MNSLFTSCLVALLILGFSFESHAAGKSRTSSKPNILFLFADDQRADTIHALGNPAIKTPALDSLVERGFAFRNAYCLGGNVGAVCTPSRNMLLSGKSYFRWTGQLAPGDPPNLPLSMQDRGYETYHHGKRSNSALEIQAKFEINKYLKNDLEDRTDGEPGRSIVDDAIAFIRERKRERPFFMYLAFGNPHDPRVAAPKYMQLYRREEIPLPGNYLPVHPFDNGEMVIRDELLAPWPRTKDEIRRHLHEYYAVISGLDHHIGRLLQALQSEGLEDDTIIIFSADQGVAIGSHGLMGKQNLYDAGMKVPLIFAGPGIPKGKSDALVYLLDIYPTLCDLVGAPMPQGLDGVSFGPVLKGRSVEARDSLFLAYRHVQRALRDKEWKLIRYPEINRSQLFDLRRDPLETNDLAADPAQAKRIERMMRQLQQWQKKLGDNQPLSSDNPKSPEFTPPSGEALEKLLRTRKIPAGTTIIDFERELKRMRFEHYRHPQTDIIKTGFRPVGGKLADFAVAHFNDRDHFFYIERRLQEGTPFYPGHEIYFGHASTPDFFEWEVHDPVMLVRRGTWEEAHVWAPVILPDGDRFVMAYTGLNRHLSQNIGLASSTDLFEWQRFTDNPISPCKGASWAYWQEDDICSCRDPDLVRHNGRILMPYTANTRQGATCIAMASTADFKQWKDHGPILVGPASGYVPNLTGGHPQGSFESPNLSLRNGRWMLIFHAAIRDKGRGTWAVASDKIDSFRQEDMWRFWEEGTCVEVVRNRGEHSLIAGLIGGNLRFAEVNWNEKEPVAKTITDPETLRRWQAP